VCLQHAVPTQLGARERKLYEQLRELESVARKDG
jgi:hypothetical protein